MKRKYAVLILVITTLTGCSTKHIRPEVSLENTTLEQFEKDLLVCQQKAEQAQSGMIKSAVVGALVGSAIASLTGGDTKETAMAAAGGAAAGAAVDAVVSGSDSAEDTVRQCLTERGYQILD